MCKVKFDAVVDGLNSFEQVVYVKNTDGHSQEITLSRKQVHGGAFEAALIHKTTTKALIELPRESASGSRRIWVESARLGA